MSLSVKPEGDRVLFLDQHNTPIGGKGQKSGQNGIQGWEKEKVSSLWHWFCHDIMGWVVDVELAGTTYVLGIESAGHFIKRNVPHLKEATIDNEVTIGHILREFIKLQAAPKKILNAPLQAPQRASFAAATSRAQARPLIQTKEAWIADFQRQGIVINEIFLKQNGFTFHDGKYSTSPENLQRAICMAPTSSDLANAQFQESMRKAFRIRPVVALATIQEEGEVEPAVAQASRKKAGQSTTSILVLPADVAYEKRMVADSARKAREKAKSEAHTRALRVPERPKWLEAAPHWLRQTDGVFSTGFAKDKQMALTAALEKALDSRVPTLNAEGFPKGDLFYLAVKKIHSGTASEILDKLKPLPLMEKFYLYDITCGAAKFAEKGATKAIMEAFFIDGIEKANSLERSRLKNYVILQLNQHEDDKEIAAFYSFVLDLVGTP